MTKEKYTYDYPRPMVTVDAILLSRCVGPGVPRRVLLVQRRFAPHVGEWALPGGFVEMEEPLEAAAARELEEETGVRGVALRQFHTFGDPGRDPRGRSITVVYAGEVDPESLALRAADDASAVGWFPVDALPAMAFDHRDIVEYAVRMDPGETDA